MRHAIRRLVSTPAFSLTAAITLAAAIGANALIFSVVHGILLKPLPFANPESLVGVWHVAPGLVPGPVNQSPATYFTYREQGSTFQDIGLWDNTSVTITARGEPEERSDEQLAVGVARRDLLARPAVLADEEVVEVRQPVQRHADDREEREERRRRDMDLAARQAAWFIAHTPAP